jgi:hypothetical protein
LRRGYPGQEGDAHVALYALLDGLGIIKPHHRRRVRQVRRV